MKQIITLSQNIEIEVDVPDGWEIDKENSTANNLKFKKKKFKTKIHQLGTKEPVTIFLDKKGNPIGVAVKTLDEFFIVDKTDAETNITWNDAMKKYKDNLPSKKQALIICAYIDKINEALEEIGGDILESEYWTETEYTSNHSWFYTGTYGCINTYGKYYALTVRKLLTIRDIK